MATLLSTYIQGLTLGLAIAVHLLGSRINSGILTWLNRICGAVIILYSIKLNYSLIVMPAG